MAGERIDEEAQAMITQARRNAIAAEMTQRQFMSTREVAAFFSCSPATARRDLHALAEDGRIRRSRGGAIALELAPADASLSAVADGLTSSVPFLAEKRRIARAAAALVKDGEAIGLPGGTTALELARCLKGRRIGVVTNSIDVALTLVAGPHTHIVLLGGVLDRSTTPEVVGPLAELALTQLRIDTLFVGVNGLSAEAGATSNGELEAQTARAMVARSRRVVVVTDHSKIGRTALTQVMPMSQIEMLVTDAAGYSPELEAIGAAGVQVLEV
jgi:DeoR family transcriptional regulator of aga operon